METYSLYDLNEYLRRVIALNFPEPMWISCEIAQCKNSRGNYYIDLVQQNENNEVIAQGSAVIWYKNFLFLRSKLGELLDGLLSEGVQVKIKVSLEYNEKYGLKLIIEDIDPSFTLGQMEINRQRILERLKKEGVTELNKEVMPSRILKRIAVISAENAAGYKDFVAHLRDNGYGYKFDVTLYSAALQGSNTEMEVVQALKNIGSDPHKYDVITIIRGGGSKLDLSAFDNFNIGHAIATCPIPVITGIGHEIDQSIADMMAYQALKTPTAVADFIVEHNAVFETEILDFHKTINRLAAFHLKNATVVLENNVASLATKPLDILKYQTTIVDQIWQHLVIQKDFIFKNEQRQMTSWHTQITMSDPKLIMKRGFTLIKSHNGYITSKSKLEAAKKGTIEFFDGDVNVIVDV